LFQLYKKILPTGMILLAILTLAGCSGLTPKEEQPFYFNKDQAKVAVIDEPQDRSLWASMLWFRDQVNSGAQPSDFSKEQITGLLTRYSNFQSLNEFQQNRLRDSYWKAVFERLSQEVQVLDNNTLFAIPYRTAYYPYSFDDEGFEVRNAIYPFIGTETYSWFENEPGAIIENGGTGKYGFIGDLRINTERKTGRNKILMSPQKAEEVGDNYTERSKTMLLTTFTGTYETGATLDPVCWTMRYTNTSTYIDERGPNRPLSDHCRLAMDFHRSLVHILADDHPALLENPEIRIALEDPK
jgi:hypothetical protein